MEIVEGGERVIERIHDASIDTLLYIVTTGDAATLDYSLHDLGVTGMFLKPVDAVIVGQTLSTALSLSR